MQYTQTKSYYIIWALAVILVGVALHFVFRISGGVFSIIFGATNGSIFERVKLLFWPLLGYMITNELIFRAGAFERQTRYLCLCLLFAAVAFFFNAPHRAPNTAVDLIISVAAVLFFFALCFLGRDAAPERSLFASTMMPLVVIVLITLTIAFSFNPPQIGLFRDPLTGGYGISEHSIV